MIKNLIKGFMLCSCLTGLMVDAMEPALIRTSSSPEMSSTELVVYGSIRPRGDSDPVTKGEKARAIKRVGVKGLLNMAKEEAASYGSVTFENVEINEEFVDKFWELFSDGLDNLTFNNCKLMNGYGFADLFIGQYQVKTLAITYSSLSTKEITDIFRTLYPYTIKGFNFSYCGLDHNVIDETRRWWRGIADVSCEL